MASVIDVFKRPTPTVENYGYVLATNESLRDDVAHLTGELREVQEDLLKISDAFDNIGWVPLPGQETKEISLKTVKKIAEVGRAMYAINPFVKRGVDARISYVWGKGLSFDGIDEIQQKISDNRKKMFSAQAYAEFEQALATDGNVFTAIPIDGKAKPSELAIRVPLEQIQDAISNPLDNEEIWYYKRSYMERKTDPSTGNQTETQIDKYYVSMAYYQKRIKDGQKNLPRNINKIGVEQNFVIQHVAVNKQVGWRWGLPDVAAVIFWAKAYKEYLEDNAMLVKAYSRLAWQIKVPSGQAGAATAAQVMRPPTRDPLTGELKDVGGTALTGLGQELSPIAANGSTVDFSKGSALAAAIASGLSVSKIVITSDPGEGNRATAETLDLPTLKAMESRQLLHTDRFLDLFQFWGAKIDPGEGISPREISEAKAFREGDPKPEKDGGTEEKYALVTWPQIQSDTTKDRITGLGTAVELGILYKQEARKEALDVFGIAPYKPWDDLPTLEDDPMAQQKFEQEQERFEAEQAAAQQQQSVIAAQGRSGGVSAKGGAQTNANSARNNRAADKNNS